MYLSVWGFIKSSAFFASKSWNVLERCQYFFFFFFKKVYLEVMYCNVVKEHGRFEQLDLLLVRFTIL